MIVRRPGLIYSVALMGVAVWSFATGRWPIGLVMIALVLRRQLFPFWLTRRIGHRATALVYTLLTGGLILVPVSPLFIGMEMPQLAVGIGLAVVGLVGIYGFIVFLLRALGGEYDQSPDVTDIRSRR